MLVDLHSHTVFSDGVLIPAESVRRAFAAGYDGIAITDHADHSNLAYVLEHLLEFKSANNKLSGGINVLVGVELTHVRPLHIAELSRTARNMGADIVLVHGETLSEPIEEGTNRAAIEAGVDILAHPGLINPEDAALAAERGVYLEITTRRGHSLSNGHVALTARQTGAKLVLNNDFHCPGDYVGEAQALRILRGAGLSAEEARAVLEEGAALFQRKLGER